jgi:DNA invertase Pin-like site-specific DNA recombinase
MRAGIYARFSSDLQRPTSIEDQIRQCRRFAEQQGWIVVEEHIRWDAGFSGATLAGREGLAALVDELRNRVPPF